MQAVVCGRCGAALGWRLVGEGRSESHPLPPASKTPAKEWTVLPHAPSTEAIALRSLAPPAACLTLERGWWTYEYCHGARMTQFHKTGKDGGRSPEWSLGTPSASDAVEVPAALALPPGHYTTHFLTRGGQPCDELGGAGRTTEVRFACCVDATREFPTLAEVVETSLCRYAATVCVPELCVRVPPPTPTPPPVAAEGPPPVFVALVDSILGDGVGLMRELEGRGGAASTSVGATLPEGTQVPVGWAGWIAQVRFG